MFVGHRLRKHIKQPDNAPEFPFKTQVNGILGQCIGQQQRFAAGIA